MPFFKLCIKIIKKNLPMMVMYIIIFLAITIAITTQSMDQKKSSFSATKINMAFISEESNPLLNGFKDKLSEYAHFVELEDNKETLQDALFFRDVDYILRVPEGFTKAFLSGDNPLQLEKTTVPASTSSAYINISFDQYFNTARFYVVAMPNITQQELVQHLKEDLDYSIPVEFQDRQLSEQNHLFAMTYFNYLAYSLFTIIILGISPIMMVMNNKDIKKRNICAPISMSRINLEYLLAHLCFTTVSWVIMMVFYFVLNYKNIGYPNTLYFMLNAFVFVLCSSSISFLIGNLVKKQTSLSAICNVITLGPCFISCIFVPQELLGESVLKIASFTPTYWYARANGIISKLTTFDSTHLQPVFTAILIQLGFTFAFLTLSMVLSKKRRMNA